MNYDVNSETTEMPICNMYSSITIPKLRRSEMYQNMKVSKRKNRIVIVPKQRTKEYEIKFHSGDVEQTYTLNSIQIQLPASQHINGKKYSMEVYLVCEYREKNKLYKLLMKTFGEHYEYTEDDIELTKKFEDIDHFLQHFHIGYNRHILWTPELFLPPKGHRDFYAYRKENTIYILFPNMLIPLHHKQLDKLIQLTGGHHLFEKNMKLPSQEHETIICVKEDSDDKEEYHVEYILKKPHHPSIEKKKTKPSHHEPTTTSKVLRYLGYVVGAIFLLVLLLAIITFFLTAFSSQ